MEQYTKLSQQAYQYAIFPTLTPQSAADWIDNSSFFRTLPEKLIRYYSGTMEEMKAFLRSGLCEIHTAPKERESIRKNVNNWFTKRKGIDDRTISRGYAIEMCFLLGLTLGQADDFLRSVNGEGLHYRDLGDFIVAYALQQQMTYDQYAALNVRLEQEAVSSSGTSSREENYTRLAEAALKELNTEADLRRYIQEHGGDFGTGHNTAYAYFTEMMEVLKNGGTGASVDELVTENLYRRFVKGNRGLSDIAKSIRSGWPDESYLSKMKNRELEVTRKTLILLYLASGGEVLLEDPWDEDNLNAFSMADDAMDDAVNDADFEGLRTQIDAMLVECGFAPLDPRVPFDWMVLFCIATGDLFDLDERFTSFLTTLFGNEV